MASEQDIEALQDQLDELKKALLQEKKDRDKTVVYSRDRKITTFSATCDVQEWVNLVGNHVESRFKDDKEKAAFVMENLDHASRTEIRFLLGSRASAEQILQQLLDSYGIKDQVIDLQSLFYSRSQKPDEKLEDYMSALMEILNNILQKDISFTDNRNNMLKFKFADGVLDPSLKRELKRVNEERPTMSSVGLRHHAIQWMDNSKSKDIPTTSAAASSNAISTDPVMTHLAAQDKRIEELTQLIRQMKSPTQEAADSARASGPRLRCNYCRKPGHRIADCYKLRNRNAAQPNQDTASGNARTSAGRADRQTTRH